MKRKLLILTSIMILIELLFLSVYKVQAYSGETDPENYITLPSMIGIKNKVGTETSNQTIREKNQNLTALQQTYQDLQQDTTATEEQTNTYYDFNGYSSEIKEESKADTEDSGTDNAGTATEGEWTDFSKAKFELKKDGTSKAIIEISNVIPKENHSYSLFITSNSNKPSANSIDYENRISLKYDKDSKTFKTSNTSKVAKDVELNQDLYATVLEQEGRTENVSSYGNKLVRFSEAMYSDAFCATFMANAMDQIVTNFTHERTNNRKIQIKVGKITDTNILQKIKNQDESGFSSLMTYAKSNTGLYDQILSSDEDDVEIAYTAGDGGSKNNVINLEGLKNDEYYYLYIKTIDEDGKYVSNEAVTLAQASVFDNGNWYLFFYGSSDFKWSEWGITTTDNSVAQGILPKAGVEYVVYGGVILIFTVSGFVAYKKYRKYNF